MTVFFLGSKITADGDCSHEIKRHFLLGRKAMTNLNNVLWGLQKVGYDWVTELNWNNVLKSRVIALPAKFCIDKAIVFPVVMYRCESWPIRKAKCWRINALKLWCWRRLLRVPWTAKKSNQSILNEINPEYSLEGLMLKLQYVGHLMWRANSLNRPWSWERLSVGREWVTEGQMIEWHHWL